MQQQQCQVGPKNEQKLALDTANLGGMIGMKDKASKSSWLHKPDNRNKTQVDFSVMKDEVEKSQDSEVEGSDDEIEGLTGRDSSPPEQVDITSLLMLIVSR